MTASELAAEKPKLFHEFSRGLMLISNGHYHGSVPCDVMYRVHRVLRVGEAALAWDAARRESVRLRAERNAIQCEREDSGEADTSDPAVPVAYGRGVLPCWKVILPPRYDGFEGQDARHLQLDEQCDSCRRRQLVQDAYRLSGRRRGAMARSVQQRSAALAAGGSG